MSRSSRTIGSGRYEVCDEVLGEGSFGKVHLGKEVGGGKVAVKIINKNRLSKHMQQRLSTELQIHSRVNHENIVKMYDVVEEGGLIYLIFEFLDGGDLFDFVIENGPLKEDEAKRIFMQLCHALQHCHESSVIHHDVKLENCMLKKDGNGKFLKLVDFGLSCVALPGQKLQTFSGTEAYCAVEILAGREYDGRLIDAYSAGVFLYICLTGSYPFSQDLEQQHQEQADMRYLEALPYPEEVSKEAKDLVMQLIHPSPTKRASVKDALNHPFMVPQQVKPKDANAESRVTEASSKSREDDDEFAFEAIPDSSIDSEMLIDWEEEDWNNLSEDFSEASLWEDTLTEYKSL